MVNFCWHKLILSISFFKKNSVLCRSLLFVEVFIFYTRERICDIWCLFNFTFSFQKNIFFLELIRKLVADKKVTYEENKICYSEFFAGGSCPKLTINFSQKIRWKWKGSNKIESFLSNESKKLFRSYDNKFSEF